MGESIELSATVYPLNVSQEVTWSITDNQEDWEVAELSGTTLTALKYGKVYLTAQSKLSYNAQQTIIIEVFHPLLEDNETFEAYLKYHFSTCERMDLIGAAAHTVDILIKEEH